MTTNNKNVPTAAIITTLESEGSVNNQSSIVPPVATTSEFVLKGGVGSGADRIASNNSTNKGSNNAGIGAARGPPLGRRALAMKIVQNLIKNSDVLASQAGSRTKKKRAATSSKAAGKKGRTIHVL